MPKDETSIDALWHMYEGMLVSRMLDEKCFQDFAEWYPAFGEEAVTIGAFGSLVDGDFAVPHYRGSMGVFWLRGMSLEEIIGGLLFRTSSVSLGRLSGLHGGDFEKQILPSVTNVLGPNVSSGTGLAMAERIRGGSGVTVIAFGDGTAALGTLHESVNMAKIYKLPILFVCQNNQYSISSRSSKFHSWDSVASWAAGYNLPSSQIDGNDIMAVRAAANEGIDRARAGGGPTLVDALTFRMGGHLSTDKAQYQSDEERVKWESKDPIKRFEEYLQNSRQISVTEISQVRERVQRNVLETWNKVLASEAVSLANQ
ncbi:MAG: thiamine pyrophosphate-dependent dehydrogenase E1 component subunit alpha [Actinobacteria bacterium]|nr:thiamine pyrophosphate-dependent dehydrogenase E1 component subunit alpha [Actinomycetota bacterium]